MGDRIDLDDDGGLDDLAISDVRDVRIERLSDRHIWMCLDTESGQIHVNITSRRSIGVDVLDDRLIQER